MARIGTPPTKIDIFNTKIVANQLPSEFLAEEAISFHFLGA